MLLDLAHARGNQREGSLSRLPAAARICAHTTKKSSEDLRSAAVPGGLTALQHPWAGRRTPGRAGEEPRCRRRASAGEERRRLRGGAAASGPGLGGTGETHTAHGGGTAAGAGPAPGRRTGGPVWPRSPFADPAPPPALGVRQEQRCRRRAGGGDRSARRPGGACGRSARREETFPPAASLTPGAAGHPSALPRPPRHHRCRPPLASVGAFPSPGRGRCRQRPAVPLHRCCGGRGGREGGRGREGRARRR